MCNGRPDVKVKLVAETSVEGSMIGVRVKLLSLGDTLACLLTFRTSLVDGLCGGQMVSCSCARRVSQRGD
jgi:hypothetical protein